MLREIMKGRLPYPPRNAEIIIHNFLVDERKGLHHKGWMRDLNTGEFKCSMSLLNTSEIFWSGTKTNGEVNKIAGTNLRWKIEDNKFVFWAEQ